MSDLSINELTLENIGQWPLPIKIGTLVVIVLFIIGMGYWFLVKPDFEQYAQLQKEEKRLRAEFELKQHQASNLQQYKNQLILMQEKFGNMLRRLPSRHEMPGLLEDISKTGIAAGLKFDLFAPESEVLHDFYVEQPIKITVQGDYDEIAVFLSRVARLNRIVTVHDFKLSRKLSKNDKEGSGDKLEMDMTAKIYRYRQQ